MTYRGGSGKERGEGRGGGRKAAGRGTGMALGGGNGRSEVSPTVIFKSWRLCTERLPSSLYTPFSLRLSGVIFVVQLRGLGASYVQALSQLFW